jgi:hypothetical protein
MERLLAEHAIYHNRSGTSDLLAANKRAEWGDCAMHHHQWQHSFRRHEWLWRGFPIDGQWLDMDSSQFGIDVD